MLRSVIILGFCLSATVLAENNNIHSRIESAVLLPREGLFSDVKNPMDSMAHAILSEHMKRPRLKYSTNGEPVEYGYYVIDTHFKSDGTPIYQNEATPTSSGQVYVEPEGASNTFLKSNKPEDDHSQHIRIPEKSVLIPNPRDETRNYLSEMFEPPAVNSTSDYGISNEQFSHLNPSSEEFPSFLDPLPKVESLEQPFQFHPSQLPIASNGKYNVHVLGPFTNKGSTPGDIQSSLKAEIYKHLASKDKSIPSNSNIQYLDQFLNRKPQPASPQGTHLMTIYDSPHTNVNAVVPSREQIILEHGIPSDLKEEMDQLEASLRLKYKNQLQSTGVNTQVMGQNGHLKPERFVTNSPHHHNSVSHKINENPEATTTTAIPSTSSSSHSNSEERNPMIYKNKYFNILKQPPSGSYQNSVPKPTHLVYPQQTQQKHSPIPTNSPQIGHYQYQHVLTNPNSPVTGIDSASTISNPNNPPHLSSKFSPLRNVNTIEKAVELLIDDQFVNTIIESENKKPGNVPNTIAHVPDLLLSHLITPSRNSIRNPTQQPQSIQFKQQQHQQIQSTPSQRPQKYQQVPNYAFQIPPKIFDSQSQQPQAKPEYSKIIFKSINDQLPQSNHQAILPTTNPVFSDISLRNELMNALRLQTASASQQPQSIISHPRDFGQNNVFPNFLQLSHLLRTAVPHSNANNAQSPVTI